jgi:hypothetical protein
LFYFPAECPKHLDKDEVIMIPHQVKNLDWDKAMVNANINIFKMTDEKFVPYFKHWKNLKTIKDTERLSVQQVLEISFTNNHFVLYIYGLGIKGIKRTIHIT